MTDTIERMARAMNIEGDKVCFKDGRLMMDTTHISSVNLSAMAVAALSALEEPSEAMVEAGGKFLSEQWEGDNWSDPDKRTRWCFEAQDCFTAMIRTAQEGTS